MRGIISVLNELYIRLMVWLGAEPPPGYEHLVKETGTREYTVKEGDTLFAIARKVGVHYDRIAKANAISDPNSVQPGQTLIIPLPDWDPASGPLKQPPAEPEPVSAPPVPAPAPTEIMEEPEKSLAPPVEAKPPAEVEEAPPPAPSSPTEPLAWPAKKPAPEEPAPTEEEDWLAKEFPTEEEPDWLVESTAPEEEVAQTHPAEETQPAPVAETEPVQERFEIEPAAEAALPAPTEAPPEEEAPQPQQLEPEPQAPGPAAPERELFRYTVQRGDTLNSIARRYGLTVKDLVDANDIPKPDLIFPGQKLIIPGYSVPKPPAASEPLPAPALPTDQVIMHNVVKGDTLSAIAKRYGVTLRHLIEANQIDDAARVRVGQKLVIPGVVARTRPEEAQPEAEPEPTRPSIVGIDSEFPPVGPLDAIRGLYVSYFAIGHSETRQHILELLDKTELNAVVIDAKGDHGWISYPTQVALAHEIGAARPSAKDFETIMAYLKARQIYTVARIVTFKDNLLSKNYPEYAVKTNSVSGTPELWQDSDQLGWTDPFLKPVWDYNIQVATEAAQIGFDEIQFDYVRFPTSSQAGAPQFSQDVTKETRVAAITSFLSAARGQIEPFGVKVGANVFGYTCWRKDDTLIGQDIERMGRYLDVLSPMLSPSTFGSGIPGFKVAVAHPYEVVYESARRATARLAEFECTVRPWIQDFPDYRFDKRIYGRAEIQAQIKAAFDAGSSGFMVWDHRVKYTDNAYAPVTRQS